MDMVKSIQFFQTRMSDIVRPLEWNHRYTAMSDFENVGVQDKRILFLGQTGSGKSFLMNVLCGQRYICRLREGQEHGKYGWEHDGKVATPVFSSTSSTESCTKETAFAKLHFLGNEARPLVAVDTCGPDDTVQATNDVTCHRVQAKIQALVADINNKLKALKFINAIVILHSDIIGNRLSPGMFEVLKLVDAKFQDENKSVWINVVVAYTRCNVDERGWRANLDDKKKEMQRAIRESIIGCNVDVDIVTLGGMDIIDDQQPYNSSQRTEAQFEELWKCISAKQPFSTADLQPFRGLTRELAHQIAEKDAVLEMLEAEKHLHETVVILALTIMVLVARTLLPSWIQIILLNWPIFGIIDELAILFFVARSMGLARVRYTLIRAWEQLPTTQQRRQRQRQQQQQQQQPQCNNLPSLVAKRSGEHVQALSPKRRRFDYM